MTQEKVDIPIDADLKAALRSLNLLRAALNSAVSNASVFENTLNRTNRLAEAVSRAIAGGAQSVSLASGKLIEANALHAQLLEQSEKLSSSYDKAKNLISASQTTLNIQLVSVKELNRRTQERLEAHRQIEHSAQRTRANLEGAASVSLPSPQSSAAAATRGGGSAAIGTGMRLAAVAAGGAVAFGKVKSAVSSIGPAIRSVTGQLDRFNIARLAGKADPALNLIRNLFNNFGATVAKIIDAINKRVDSMLTHWRESFSSGVGAFAQINQALGRVFATIVKHLNNIGERLQAGFNAKGSMIPGLEAAVKMQEALFGKMFEIVDYFFKKIEARAAGSPFAGIMQGVGSALNIDSVGGLDRVGTILEGLADRVAKFTQSMGEAEAKLAGAAGIATGRFQQTSGVMSDYASAVNAAAAPARILNRILEIEQRLVHGVNAGLAFLRRGFMALMGPIISLRNRQRQFNELLKNAPPAYRMAAIAIDYLKAAFRALVIAVSAVVAPIRLIVNLITKLIGPLQSLGNLIGKVTGGFFGFGKGAAKAKSDATGLIAASGTLKNSLVSLEAASRKTKETTASMFASSGGGIKSMLGGLLKSKLALGAMAAAALSWGGATAIATETATVKFGTLLQDMGQGKALIGEITAFSAATPFSNEALRESAGLLLAAQVPANEITKRLQMLGDIASGTSQPIGDLSKVFQKVASTGKLGLGEINQLAERGIPIYSALQDTLGVSREEMLKMVSAGELGFANMDAALQSLTAAGGMFAGGMATQSQTFAGLFSTLKDNVAIALESVVSVLMPFAKRMLSIGIKITQGFVAAFQRIRPVLQMWFEATAALFQLLTNAAVYAFESIASLAALAFGSMGSNGGGILQGLMEGFMIFYATAKFAFENIGLTWNMISVGITLAAVQMFNGMVHWLTVALPAYMSWFGENWSNLFTDMGVATLTIFENMFKNIKSILNAIWAFIKSAGMSSIEVAWTPLLDGFIATTKKLPDIPTRQIGAMEAALMKESEALSTKFATGLEAGIADAMKMLEPEKQIELKGGKGIDTTMPEQDEDSGGGRSRTSFVVDAMDKNSEAALKAVLGAKDDQTPKKQLSALQQIVKNTKPQSVAKMAVQGAIP